MSAKVAAIVLAAGRSSRMAPRNKLLELLDGKTIVARGAEAAIASGAEPVIVVTGFDASRIGEAVENTSVTVVHNPAFEQGLSTSLRAGLSVLPAEIEGALICLGDMPNVEVSVLCALMEAFTGSSAICVPVHCGRRGNPVLWGRDYFAEMMKLTGDVGAKSLLAQHPDRVIEVDIGTGGIFEDVDTSADLARVQRLRD